MEIITSLEETKSLASKLAKAASAGDCFCLTGDLGAGKTEFARAFIQSLYGNVNVSSPTFNILQVYEGENNLTINHFDLYRIKDDSELEEIGFFDALNNGICLIEWPQVAEFVLPQKKRTNIHIEILDEDRRKITITTFA